MGRFQAELSWVCWDCEAKFASSFQVDSVGVQVWHAERTCRKRAKRDMIGLRFTACTICFRGSLHSLTLQLKDNGDESAEQRLAVWGSWVH